MTIFEELRPLTLFDGLSDEQLADLVRLGEEVSFEPGQELFREGDPADHWWVLVDGSLELVRHVAREESRLGMLDVPGRWAGGFRAWNEHGAYLVTARGVTPGRLLRVPAPALRAWTQEHFPFGEHLIDGVFRTVRDFETVIRQREALVALGTLAAGLMHEINNPAAASGRAIVSLEAATDSVLDSLRLLAAARPSAEQFIELDALRQELKPAAPIGGGLELSDREEALAEWMADRGVDRAWELAAPLAAAGADLAWCERLAEAIDGEALQHGIEWIASSTTSSALLGELRESMARISQLVGSVRSYSALDRASMVPTDVREGLDSTLAILAHKIPDGTSVDRDFDPELPAIEAAGGELNQVWTNLIDNAVHAMGGTGVLRVSARAEDDAVVVEVADSGAGMPPEVQAHAFEPFFTTKGVGEGTGLGLDISRRIVVDRHTGHIEIISEPGRTVVRVRLPLRQPRPTASD